VIHGLKQFKATIWLRPNLEGIDFFVSNLGNLRAALDWGFSAEGDTALGARLAAESTCFFFQAGLLPECAAWAERAIVALDAPSKGTHLELELLACFASALMVTRGNLPTTQSALLRALDIADCLNVAPMQLYLLHALYKWQIRSGDLRGFPELTRRVESVAAPIADPLADAIAHGFHAITCFFAADNRQVGRHAHIALTAPVHLSTLNLASFGHLHRVRVILARNAWVLGYPEQAMATNEEAIREAENLNHPFTLCYILMSCVLVPMETGNWQRAEELLQRLSAVATKHHLLTYARASVGWEGCLAVLRGDVPRGIDLLQTAIVALHEDGYELYRPHLSLALAEGLARTGRYELAFRTISEALNWTQTRGRILSLIDQLRVKGELLGAMSPEDISAAEESFLESLQLARERGLLSMQLRTAASLARLWAARGQRGRALGLLEPIFKQFTEGYQTRDLIAADNLLQQLRAHG
jgi:tetratricopeptide (TPR) repeat protein